MHDTFVPLMKKNHPEETRGKSDAEIWAMADIDKVNSREAAELAHDNMIQMQKAGVQITPQTLAGAHRLGAGGIIAVLKADPNTPMSAIVPAAFSQGGNMDIHDLTAAQFLAKPYPGGGGGGGGDPTGQNASWQRMQQNFQQAQEAMREITQDYRKDRDRVRDLASRYKPFEPTPAPRPPEVDPMQSFGGIASIFVALAAGLSRTPAVAAMNGLAGVIDGAREKDWTKYAANYKAWKDNSEYAYKAHEEYSKDINEAMEMMTKDVNLGEAMLKATLAIGGQYEKDIQEWRERPLDFQIKQDAAVKARQEMQKRQEDIDDDVQLRGLNGQRDAAREQFTAAQATNDLVKVAEAQKHLTDAEADVERKLTDIEKRKAAQLGGRSRGTGGVMDAAKLRIYEQWVKDNPDATAEQKSAFFNNVMGKEDPGERTRIRQQEADTRADRAKADADYKEKMAALGQDKRTDSRQLAESRIAAAKEFHQQNVELAVKKLDQNASQFDRKENEKEKHDRFLEAISNDKVLNDAEKARLKREEDIRWHDMSDARGWGVIKSREQIAKEGNDLKREHEADWVKLGNDKTATTKEIADKRIESADKYHASQVELKLQGMQLTDERQKETARHNLREEEIRQDKLLNDVEKNSLVLEESKRWHDLSNARGWGGIEQRDRSGAARNATTVQVAQMHGEFGAAHDARVAVIQADNRLSREQKDAAILAERKRKAEVDEAFRVDKQGTSKAAIEKEQWEDAKGVAEQRLRSKGQDPSPEEVGVEAKRVLAESGRFPPKISLSDATVAERATEIYAEAPEGSMTPSQARMQAMHEVADAKKVERTTLAMETARKVQLDIARAHEGDPEWTPGKIAIAAMQEISRHGNQALKLEEFDAVVQDVKNDHLGDPSWTPGKIVREANRQITESHQRATSANVNKQVYEDVLKDVQADPKFANQPRGAQDIETIHRMADAHRQTPPTLNDAAADMEAKQFLMTGQMPSMGIGGLGARTQILNRAAEIAMETGHTIQDYIVGRATLKADAGALSQITKIASAVDAFEKTALKNMDVAEALMNKGAGTAAGPVVNRWLQRGRYGIGDKDVAEFDTAMGAIQGEYAKIISGGSASIAASPEGARLEAQKWLDAMQSPAAIRGQFAVARRDMQNRITSLREEESILRKHMLSPVDADKSGGPTAAPQQTGGLPERKDLVKNKLYPGYGTWTGTGFRPEASP
jgi:hypothetical protein